MRDDMIETTASDKADSKPHPIDVHVGHRIRIRRTLVGLTQSQLATSVGLTFQQIQKYEKGANRVSASKLYEISHVLDVPVSFFFDDLPPSRLGAQRPYAEPPASTMPPDVLDKRETLEQLRSFLRIRDPLVRKRIAQLITAVVTAQGDEV